MTQQIDWSAFDRANGLLALAIVETDTPAHVPAIRAMLAQGVAPAEIAARFANDFPGHEAMIRHIKLAAAYLASEAGQ